MAFNYLGADTYGVWAAATSLTSMALFADLGIGNGLLTSLARSRARGDVAEGRRATASAYLLLIAVMFVTLLIATTSLFVFDWPALLNVKEPNAIEQTNAIVIACFASFALNIPGSIIQRVQYASGEVGRSNIWQTVASIVSVGTVFTAVELNFSAPAVVAASVFALPAINMLNTVTYFLQNPNHRPSIRDVSLSASKELATTGGRFFAISVLSAGSLNADLIVISNALGTKIAGEYAIIAKLYATLNLFVTIVGLVLWPANTEALVRGDAEWVRTTARRVSIIAGLATLAAGIPLVLSTDHILRAWISSSGIGATPLALPIFLLMWSVTLAAASPYFMVQNSVGVLSPQLIGWAIFLPLSSVAKLVAVRTIGVAGVPLVGITVYGATLLPAVYVGYKRALDVASRRR
jgi:O-antigen/teichoic acid export membrane protein